MMGCVLFFLVFFFCSISNSAHVRIYWLFFSEAYSKIYKIKVVRPFAIWFLSTAIQQQCCAYICFCLRDHLVYVNAMNYRLPLYTWGIYLYTYHDMMVVELHFNGVLLYNTSYKAYNIFNVGWYLIFSLCNGVGPGSLLILLVLFYYDVLLYYYYPIPTLL